MIIRKIEFDDILPIWQTCLWPNRSSVIKEMSSMSYLGGYDMSIYTKYIPTFWALYDKEIIVGVNSGFRTTDELYCSRGLWINPSYRKKGLTTLLFEELEKQALLENCTSLWSIPRKTSLVAYLKFGFVQTSDWFIEGVEFGPNCYVLKNIL